MNNNIILNTDSYKVTHYKQYPAGAQYVYSYIESRGTNGDIETDYTIFFGLQMMIKKYLETPITQEMIDEAADVYAAHGVPFNREGWEYILNEHNGYLPLAIFSVPEGTKIEHRNVMCGVVNTDPRVSWLTSYLETALLRGVWYPTTVATNSNACYMLLKEYWKKTSDDPIEALSFKLHDFGARGVSSEESAAIGGLSHLVNFMGTDTVSGLLQGRKYYNSDMPGFSIPAAEHSTMTSWGKDYEVDAYRNMINQFAPDCPLIAIVSDSYDLDNALNNIYGEELKEEIKNCGSTIVIRPDSGEPEEIVVSTILQLMDKFGYETNSKGYNVLPSYIRVIQGDGINYESLGGILKAMDAHGLSLDNVAFGMGGGLLQQMNRDTFKFAMKASAIQIDGSVYDVYKMPKTDPSKMSKKGIVYYDGETTRKASVSDMDFATIARTIENGDNFRLVYYNGELQIDETLDQIRERAKG